MHPRLSSFCTLRTPHAFLFKAFLYKAFLYKAFLYKAFLYKACNANPIVG
jgi:hypothetical protein